MAHLEKYKQAAVHAMLHHYERDREGVLERENIDRERTELNYTIGDGDVLRAIEEAIETHNEHGRALREDAVVMADWVTTAPRDLEPERTREFFEHVHAFQQERYGEDNVPRTYVHMDETTAHAHTPVIPLSEEGRLQASRIIDRADLQSWHRDLERYIEQQMGRSYEITLSQERAAERELSRLPQSEYIAAKQELEQTREAQERAQQEVERARAEQAAELARLESLRHSREAAERRVEGLQQQVERNQEQTRELVDRASVLERGVERLRGGVERLRERAGHLRELVGNARDALERARERLEEVGRKIGDARYVLNNPDKIGHSRYEAAAVRCAREIGWDRPDMWRDRELDVRLDREQGITRDRPNAREMIDMATRAARDLYQQRTQEPDYEQDRRYDRGR